MEDPELLDPAQLAQRLNVSRGTVDNWRSRGLITPSIAQGKVLRYVLADVLEELKPKKKARR